MHPCAPDRNVYDPGAAPAGLSLPVPHAGKQVFCLTSRIKSNRPIIPRLPTSFGDVEVSVPRDRKGEFEPQVLKKGQTSISQDVEEKILSMYAKGMTTSDIEAHIQDIYGIFVSDSTIS